MACERWCARNRGCVAGCRWPYVLPLLALCALGPALAAEKTDASYYNYGVPSRGRSYVDYDSPHFSFLPDSDVPIRRRRAPADQMVVSTEPQPQDDPRQSVPNATSTSVNVPYSTDYAETGAKTPQTVDATQLADLTSWPTTPTPKQAFPKVGGALWQSRMKLTSPTNFKPAEPLKDNTKVTELTPVDPLNMSKNVKEDKEKKTEKESKENKESKDEKEATESDIDDISISKFSGELNKTLQENNITKTEVDAHQYYNSTFIVDEAVGKKYWVDLDHHPELKVNSLLSKSHQRAATVKLKFDFLFYGHKVRNITIATGGFLYTGEYLHNWLAATQYIAPLMANFDTRLSNESYVKYADNGTAFTVEWEKVVLQDKPGGGPFTFQATLHENGDIVFVYSVIPLVVEDIKDTVHPVKVGLSDAFIMDRTVFFVRRKTIYEYHRVNFNQQDIKNWTVIYLRALPTCLEMDNCRDCLTKLTEFDCKWCSALNQCSTGTFRSRQDWLLKGCDVRNTKDVNNCPAATTTYKQHEADYDDGHVHTDEAVTVSETVVKKKRPGASSLEHTRDNNMNMGVSGIIGILLVVALVAGLGGWAAYAYRNPHSASGQMLIRYRPSQWSWRRGEARYTAATIHM